MRKVSLAAAMVLATVASRCLADAPVSFDFRGTVTYSEIVGVAQGDRANIGLAFDAAANGLQDQEDFRRYIYDFSAPLGHFGLFLRVGQFTSPPPAGYGLFMWIKDEPGGSSNSDRFFAETERETEFPHLGNVDLWLSLTGNSAAQSTHQLPRNASDLTLSRWSSKEVGMYSFETGTHVIRVRLDAVSAPFRQITSPSSPWGSKLYAPSQLNNFITYLESPAGASHADIALLPDLKVLRESGLLNLSRRGCLITSYTMALSHLGLADQNPGEFYDRIDPIAITPISNVVRMADGSPKRDRSNVPLFKGADLDHTQLFKLYPTLQNVETNSMDVVAAALRRGDAVLFNVKGGAHWVFAQDIRSDGTIQIVDPGGSAVLNDRAYPLNTIKQDLRFKKARILSHGTAPRAILQTKCPIEVTITSPTGARLGLNPLTGQSFDEIANSSYFAEYPILAPDEEYTDDELTAIAPALPHLAFINELVEGTYRFEVFGVGNGGDFAFDFSWRTETGSFSTFHAEGSISVGEVRNYDVFVTTVPEPVGLILLASLFLFPSRVQQRK